jgi:hypothetical protein
MRSMRNCSNQSDSSRYNLGKHPPRRDGRPPPQTRSRRPAAPRSFARHRQCRYRVRSRGRNVPLILGRGPPAPGAARRLPARPTLPLKLSMSGSYKRGRWNDRHRWDQDSLWRLKRHPGTIFSDGKRLIPSPPSEAQASRNAWASPLCCIPSPRQRAQARPQPPGLSLCSTDLPTPSRSSPREPSFSAPFGFRSIAAGCP